MNNVEKPDLKTGVPLATVPDGGKILGVVDGEDALPRAARGRISG
jgi:hypothetical protein